MNNSSNDSNNSQAFFSDLQENNIQEILYRLSEPELIVLDFVSEASRSISSFDIEKSMGLSGSAASSILTRLAAPSHKDNERIAIPLLTRKPLGPRKSYLYSPEEQVRHEDIKNVLNDRNYSREKFFTKQAEKKQKATKGSSQDSVNTESTESVLSDSALQANESNCEVNTEATTIAAHSVAASPLNPGDFTVVWNGVKQVIAEREAEIKRLKEENDLLRKQSQSSSYFEMVEFVKSSLS